MDRYEPELVFIEQRSGRPSHWVAMWPDKADNRFPGISAYYGIGSTPQSAVKRLNGKHGWEPWRPNDYRAPPMTEDEDVFRLVPPDTALYVDRLLSEIINRHTENR